MKFGRKKRRISEKTALVAQTVPKDRQSDVMQFSRFEVQSKAERELFQSLRESVPVIDAALCKIVRLIGKFSVVTSDGRCQSLADDLIKNVKTNGSSSGLYGFVYSYLDSLLTYGEAVGEMIPDASGYGIKALYNASLDDVEIRADKSPLDLIVCRNDSGTSMPVKYQQLVLASLLNPQPGTVHGTSILKGLPFVSSILLRIFNSIKTNWERVGDVRFAVTYNPDSNGGVFTEESAKMIADEQNRLGRPLPINTLLVLNMLKEMPKSDVKQLSEALNLSEILVKTVLDKSIENGLVEAYGAGRGRNYILSHNLFQDKSKSIGYVRQKDIDETRYTELILNMARSNEFISRADVMNLLHVKDSKAYGLLKKLAEEGLLMPPMFP